MTTAEQTEAAPLAPRAYSTEQVAVVLGRPAHVVRSLIRTGRLRARNTGKSYIVPASALEEYLAGGDDPIQVAG